MKVYALVTSAAVIAALSLSNTTRPAAAADLATGITQVQVTTEQPSTVVTEKTTTITNSISPPAVFIESPGTNVVTTMTTVSPSIIVTLVRPDDLIRRSRELSARILVEQTAGSITSAEASDLLNRMQQIASLESGYKANGMTWWEVEHLYRQFDKVGSDLDRFSTDSKKTLAGNFIVL